MGSNFFFTNAGVSVESVPGFANWNCNWEVLVDGGGYHWNT